MPGSYESYSERTRQNLVSQQFSLLDIHLLMAPLMIWITFVLQKNLKEDVIDYDLLEDLISYIDDNHPPGAILVFLPVSSRRRLFLFFM